MRYLLPLLVVVLVCCSKTTNESGSADSTATSGISPTEQANIIKLTAEELEQVHLAIFFRLHEYQLFSGEPGWLAYKEEYKFTENSFTYDLIRSNKFSGYYESDYGEGGQLFEDPYDVIAARAAAQQEADEVNEMNTEVPDEPEEYDTMENIGIGGDYNEEADEASYSEGEAYGEGDYEEPITHYLNEFDTLSGSGMLIAILESRPEDPIKTVRCKISGSITWTNHHYARYGEPELEPRSYSFEDIVVELGGPMQIGREQLYLKAKVMPLTDKDIAGMSKEEISYLRNEIFARHGHSFQTKKMRDHFEPLDWYFPRVEDAGPLLNSFEKQNVEFLKKKEA